MFIKKYVLPNATVLLSFVNIMKFSFSALMEVLGMDLDCLESYMKNLTINQAVNEDCIFSIFDLFVSNILKNIEKNNWATPLVTTILKKTNWGTPLMFIDQSNNIFNIINTL